MSLVRQFPPPPSVLRLDPSSSANSMKPEPSFADLLMAIELATNDLENNVF